MTAFTSIAQKLLAILRTPLGLIVTAQTCLHSTMAGVRLLVPLWALTAGYSALVVGIYQALFSLGAVFFALAIGRYCDRHGLQRPVRVGVVLACCGALAAVLYPSLPTMAIAAVGCGIGAHFGVLSGQRYVGHTWTERETRRQAFAWLALGPGLANMIGPALAGLLLDAFDFRVAFFVMLLLPLLSMYVIRSVVEQAPAPNAAANRLSDTAIAPEAEPVSTEITPSSPAAAAAPKPTWGLLDIRGLRLVFFTNLILSACWDVHALLLPLLGHSRNMSASSIGMVLGVFGLATVVVRVLLPVLTRGFDESKVLGLAMVMACAVMAVYPLTTNVLQMSLLSGLLGLVLGSVQPQVMTLLAHYSPANRQGEVLGLRFMLVNISSVSVPLLFGSLGASIGITPLYWLLAVALGLGARLPYLLSKHEANHKQENLRN